MLDGCVKCKYITCTHVYSYDVFVYNVELTILIRVIIINIRQHNKSLTASLTRIHSVIDAGIAEQSVFSRMMAYLQLFIENQYKIKTTYIYSITSDYVQEK